MSRTHFRAIRNLKTLASCGAILLGLALAAPAMAQITIQIGSSQVPGFSNNYPWFNDVPQYQGNQSFRWFLATHPNIANALARDPGLLYNANWRSEFPPLERYLENHPYEWQALNGQDWSEGPAETQWGYYDNQHQWRDAYWWHQNDPNWFYDNHASWASLDSRWLNEDGAYDQQNQWHYGEWWYNQNPNWVTTNHPNWLNEHRNWQQPQEQQNYRRQHAMAQPNQRAMAEPNWQATQQQDQRMRQQQNQQNQQRAADQRQANLQQQRTMRQENQQRQHQVNHAQNLQQQANREQQHAAQQQPRHQQQQHQQQQHSGQQQRGNEQKRAQ